ncbi:hypothetical protein GCM10010970_23050 [Silvimonas iriomotensis]|uniref:Uncharacterized protein n=1 Tax=Silvimonas iriomotensis TaxID=449662 RepID=A0ABQ2PAZ7_9NEIS|nr:hypothetical protein GCM10010970_23050 [Silvimonas iriomotensis]
MVPAGNSFGQTGQIWREEASVFEVLDEMLSKECSVDYWGDELILKAWRAVDEFSEEDWSSLSQVWRDKPEDWQYWSVPVSVDTRLSTEC